MPDLNRRTLLQAAGLGVAAAALPALPARAALPAAAASDPRRFDLSAPGTPLFLTKPLHNKTVLQSIAFDNVNGHVYTVQLMAGGQQLLGEAAPVSGANRDKAGDLCLTQLDLDGTERGHMFLKGFGHGVQIGAEPVGESAFLWTETDAIADDGLHGWGSRLARFRFQNGAILTPDSPEVRRLRPVPGADRTTCGIDPVQNRLVMRHRIAGTFRYALYDLDDLRANRFAPIVEVDQPSLTYSFQGYAASGDYLYLLEGSSYGSAGSTAPVGNTHITCVEWATGSVVARQLVTDGSDLPFREPEGMAIQVPDAADPSRVRLAFGFATTTSPTDTAKLASVYYKDVLI
ncbi:MAG: Tat pathway signal sequence domain protein [Hamadaea sp.]|nr:Tat pathway signal sequence domain protein [Hamadaea sp.]